MLKRMPGGALLAAALAGAAFAAEAHEFWIRPERFAVAAGEPLAIGLAVGTGWPGETFARQPARIVRFALLDIGGAGEREIDGVAGAEPAGRVTAARAGSAWAVYRSNGAEVHLDAERFEAYLIEEGLQAIVEQRRRRGKAAQPGRERYSRCAKALLTVSGGAQITQITQTTEGEEGGAGALETPVGLALEIVPRSDPRRVALDGRLDVEVLHLGRPLPNALVKAMREAGPARWFSARTDAEGRARLELPTGDGVWLVNTVQMQAAPPRSGHEWDSTWSSLTFETTAPRAGPTRDVPQFRP